MKAAFAIWEGRIAPVFDVAHQAVLAQKHHETDTPCIMTFPDDEPEKRLSALMNRKVDVLVCGAVSRFLHNLLSTHGISVLAFVKGDVDLVIRAWRANQLEQERYTMPGCRGRHGCRRQQTEFNTARNKGTRGNGKGGAQARFGQRSTNGGTQSAERVECLCPQCGYQKPHVRGVPCVRLTCPHCRTPLTRATL